MNQVAANLILARLHSVLADVDSRLSGPPESEILLNIARQGNRAVGIYLTTQTQNLTIDPEALLILVQAIQADSARLLELLEADRTKS
jgi:hypothetical protein